jgi:methylmalonyl-CoA mutase
VQSGWVARQIDSAFAPRARNIARRKEGITGVSEFPDAGEKRVVHPPPDQDSLRATAARRIVKDRRESAALARLGSADAKMAAAVEAAERGASIEQLAHGSGFHVEAVVLPPLTPHTFAEPFEELRDASDAWQSAHGKRPCVFLVNLGTVAHHTARATYAMNFFEAGGFAVQGNDGFKDAATAVRAFVQSGATVAVLCSSDKLYPQWVPQVAPMLKSAGARSVILTGNPGVNETAWRAAGVDRFIFMKCDVLGTLREMLREEGVLAGGE